ncbi:MAG: hypothetical protein HW389_3290 [Bacteroidetes bacterium]|nr:hypothetical protein [Bacteroidota bacterium]
MVRTSLHVRLLLAACILFVASDFLSAQRLIDKSKGNHNETKKGFMDGNLVSTVYYNFGEIADWLNEPSRSGVWPKGTNHTYAPRCRDRRDVRLVATAKVRRSFSVESGTEHGSQHLAFNLA